MKKIILLSLLLVSFQINGQKKELKVVEKQIKSENFTLAINNLNTIKDKISPNDKKTLAKFYYLNGLALYQNGNSSYTETKASINNLNKSISTEIGGNNYYTTRINKLKVDMLNNFISNGNNYLDEKLFEKSYENFELAYRVSTRDTLYLRNAALVANQANNYEKALDFYLELIDLNYTGISMTYYAIEKESGDEQRFQDAESRDFSINVIKTHEKPRDELGKSEKDIILRTIAAIYRDKKDFDNALKYIELSKEIDPNNINLILLESNIRWELGDVESYEKLITKALEINPENTDLVFNLGVVNADKGNIDLALEFYNKAYLNAAALILEKDEPIIEEMNSLGMSTADYNRYDELKLIREDLFKSAIPYLNKVYELDPNNIDCIKTLRNIYEQLGETDEAKKYRELLQSF
jgi:tetratricopeptide (TPR) repeat protein